MSNLLDIFHGSGQSQLGGHEKQHFMYKKFNTKFHDLKNIMQFDLNYLFHT